MSILNETMKLLRKTQKEKRLNQVSKGSGIPLRWLYKLLNGEIAGPKVQRIEKLHGYLKRKA